jgi:hypothetical protein
VNSQQLLYINILVGILIVLYFVFGRGKTKQIARLRIRDLPPKDDSADIDQTPVPPAAPEMLVLEPEAPPKKEEVKPDIVIQMPTRTQKIYFAFNGHDWEAYEALGVPVNAPLTTVTKMYQHLIKTSDTSTFDFYESAYSAIIQKRKEQK